MRYPQRMRLVKDVGRELVAFGKRNSILIGIEKVC